MLLDAPVFLTVVTSEPAGEGDLVFFQAERLERAGGEEHLRTLERFAQPSSRLTLAQARTTGLTNQQLDEAPDLDEALQDLVEFSDGASAWVVADGAAVRESLKRAASRAGFPRAFGPPVAGADELGGLVLPTVCRRGVADLIAHYGLADFSPSQPPDAGAASAVAPASSRLSPALLRELWARLEADLLKVPLPVLAEMNWLLSKSPHPLKVLLKKAESSAVEAQFAQTFSSGKLSITSLYKDYSELIKRLQPKGEEDSPDEGPIDAEPVAPGQAAELLGPVGPLAKSLPAYEHRREQIEMAERVASAFGSGRHLLSEAGTGVGKSIAYLVPAILFAKQNERPVVVSTHTKNLQSQLFHKDIPLLKRALPVEFTAALLKGRPNYLCLRKFTYTLQEAAHELDEDERAALLPVMNWSTQTKDGDVAELAAFSPEQHPELWDRLHTVGEDCLSRACPFYHRCFVYKARAAARLADVVVCNHALVFADLNKENGSLPNYGEIVFDEAHTLEDVATEHLACEITPRRLYRILTKLFRAPQGSSAGKGLLPSLLFQLEMAKAEFPEPLFESIREHVLNAIQAVSPANAGSDVFFDSIRDWFERAQAPGDDDSPVSLHVPRERGRSPVQLDESGQADPFFSEPARAQRRPFGKQRGGAKAGDDRKRYSASTLRPEETDLFQEAKTSAISGLGRLRQTLDLLEEDFKEIKKRPVARARELHKELTAQNLFLQELISDLEFVVKSDEPNYVYWMEKLGRRAMRVVAAPLDLAAILHGQLYERKRSVVLTSATLSVRDAGADAGSGMAPIKKPDMPEPVAAEEAGELSPPDIWKERAGISVPVPHKKSFEFLKHRLGLTLCEEGQVDELLEGSPFDYTKQCRLYLPVFLPPPESRDFNTGLSALVAKLAVASQGRALVLYTSYASLNAGAAYLRKALAPEGIEVLAQGEDGSREALLAKLKAGGRSVLLGTASFWEGVDVPGDALSLLIIAKLPFQVFTDPIIQGRCELLEAQGKDPFLHFSVPNAILKLRQGFGRLIRTKSDRGIVVLCDKRVLTKRYGPAFLRALPAQARQAHDADALAEEIGEFLAPGSV
ncbi:MAG: hypothetical protein KIS92_09735 [Planctomycetota bacterium]|nr:hypothetical protein [Planctomycetota bacterium]